MLYARTWTQLTTAVLLVPRLCCGIASALRFQVADLLMSAQEDQAALRQLQKTVDEQAATVEREEERHRAVQRNYETVSILAKQSQEKIGQLERELELVRAKNRELEEMIKTVTEKKLTLAEVDQLRADNMALKADQRDLQAAHDKATARVKVLETVKDELEQETDTLKARMRSNRSTLESRMETLEVRNRDLEKSTKKAMADKDAAESALKVVQIESAERGHTIDELRDRMAETDVLMAEVQGTNERLVEEKSKLGQALQAANQRCQSTLQRMKHEFEGRVSAEKGRLAQTLKATQADLDNLQFKHARVNEDLEAARAANEKLEATNRSLKDDMSVEAETMSRVLDESRMRLEEEHAKLRNKLLEENRRESDQARILQEDLRERIANQEAEFVRKTKAMKTKEQELHNTIGKLLNVEEAFDNSIPVFRFQANCFCHGCIRCGLVPH